MVRLNNDHNSCIYTCFASRKQQAAKCADVLMNDVNKMSEMEIIARWKYTRLVALSGAAE